MAIVAILLFAISLRPVLLLLQVFPQIPLKPLSLLTRQPVVGEVEFNYKLMAIEGRLFRSSYQNKYPALILALALKSSESDKRQIDNFAEAAARLGFVVLVPHSKDLQVGNIKIEDKDTFIGAFEFLKNQPWVNEKKISYVGISAGSSIALKAASDPAISDKVQGVLFFGGYFDAKDYFSSLILGKARFEDEEIIWEPDPGAIWHAKEVIISLAPEDERPVLNSVLHEGKDISSRTMSELSPESKFAILVFSTTKPEELTEIWDGAPQIVNEHIQRLSPSDGIKNLRTRVFILHDRGDRYVSFLESRKLNDALPRGYPKSYLEVSLFEHVQPKGGINPAILFDLIRLSFFAVKAMFFLS